MDRESGRPEKHGVVKRLFGRVIRTLGNILVTPMLDEDNGLSGAQILEQKIETENLASLERTRLRQLYDDALRSKIPPLPRSVGEQRGVIPASQDSPAITVFAQYGENAQPGDSPTHVLFLAENDASGRDLSVYSFWQAESGEPYASHVHVREVKTGPKPTDFRIVPAADQQSTPAHPATELEILGLTHQLELTKNWASLYARPS